MSNEEIKINANKLESIFNIIANQSRIVNNHHYKKTLKQLGLRKIVSNKNVLNIDSSPSEAYDGSFANEVTGIVKKPLTFKNIQNAIQQTRKNETKINNIIDRINKKNERLENIRKLMEQIKVTEMFLDKYCSTKLIPPWILRDKLYLETKTAIINMKKDLADKYKVSNQNDLKKRMKSFEPKKQKLGFYKKLLDIQSSNRKVLIISLRQLAQKIKGNIVSKHPELAQFIDLLSCEQATRLKVLKEDFNFIPKNKDDFIKEVKECSIKFKRSEYDKKYFELKLNYLISISKELQKGIDHKQFLEKELTRSNLGKSIDIGFGRTIER